MGALNAFSLSLAEVAHYMAGQQRSAQITMAAAPGDILWEKGASTSSLKERALLVGQKRIIKASSTKGTTHLIAGLVPYNTPVAPRIRLRDSTQLVPFIFFSIG